MSQSCCTNPVPGYCSLLLSESHMDIQQVFNDIHILLLVPRAAEPSWVKGIWGSLCKFNVILFLFTLQLGYPWETCVKDWPTSGKEKKPKNYARGGVLQYWKSLDSKRIGFGRTGAWRERRRSDRKTNKLQNLELLWKTH